MSFTHREVSSPRKRVSFQRPPSRHQRPAKPSKQTVPNRHRALPHRKQCRRRLLATFLVAIAPIRQGPVSARSRARLVRSPQSRSTTGIVTSRYRPHAPFGIGAEQLLGVGELGPSPPTEQAVDREISLDVVDEEQRGVCQPQLPGRPVKARKKGTKGAKSVPSESRNALFAFLGSSQILASSVADAESCRSIICGLY